MGEDEYELRAEITHLRESLQRQQDDAAEAAENWVLERNALLVRAERAEKRLEAVLVLSGEYDQELDWRRELRRVVGSVPAERTPAVATTAECGCKKCLCCAQWSRLLSGIERNNAQLRDEIHVYESKLYRNLLGVWDDETPFGSEPEEPAGTEA